MSFFYHSRGGHVEAAEAKGDARRSRTDFQEMEARLDKAMLACEAMWTFMRDKFGLNDEQLAERINDIDLSDGQLDGKVRKPAVTCPKCGRNSAQRFAKCMYCGQALTGDPFS